MTGKKRGRVASFKTVWGVTGRKRCTDGLDLGGDGWTKGVMATKHASLF